MDSHPPNPLQELLGMSGDTAEPGDLSGMLQRLTRIARERFRPDSWACFAVNHITEQFVPSLTFAPDSGQEIEPELLAGLKRHEIVEPLLDQQVLLVEDLAAAPDYADCLSGLDDVQAFAAVALLTRQLQKPLAVLYLNFNQPHQFEPEDQAWLQSLADQAAPLLQHGWLVRRYQAITGIGQEINHQLGTVEAIFKTLQHRATDILDIRHFFMLAIYQPQTDHYDLLLSENGQFRALPNNTLNGGYEWVLQKQEPLLIHELSAEGKQLPAQLEEIRGTDFRDRESLIFVPLASEGIPVGLLSIQHPDPHIYNINDLHILRLLGNYVASALNNMRTFSNLRQLNETGQLLTQKLGSEEFLQNLVDRLRAATKADLVVLYPYKQATRQFDFPPRRSGDLLQVDTLHPSAARSDDIASLALQQTQSIFAEDSTAIYGTLRDQSQRKKGTFAKREKIESAAVIPLRVVDEAVGVLFLNFRKPQSFDGTTKQLIQGLANYAAVAIKNAREFGSLTHRHIQELEILQRIDREISKTLDLQQVLQTILRLVSEHIAPDKGAIFLYEPGSEVLVKEAAIGRDAEANLNKAIPLDQEKGITRWVFQYKKPVRVGNVRQDPNWRELYIEGSSEILSEMDVPLLDRDEVIGIINLESATADAFSEADQHFLVTLAGQAVLAVKRAQAYEEQKRLLRERQALDHIGQKIIGQLEPGRVFELILTEALDITNSDVGTLMLYDPQRSDLWMAAERGVSGTQKGKRHGLHEGITGWVARKKKLLKVGDISAAPWNTIHLPFIPGIRSELAVPLLEGNRLRGVINIESPEPNHFDDSDERLLTELADLAVIALKNSESYQEAKEGRARLQALHDVDRKIISQLGDPDQVMRTILENAAILTKAERVGLHLYENGRAADIYRARLSEQDQELAIQRIEATQRSANHSKRGIVARVANTHKPYLTQGDAQNDPYYRGNSNTHSEVAVPLLSVQNDLIGILNLESPRHYAFDNEDVGLLELFASQAVIAIQNARAYAAATRRESRFRLLHEAAEKLGKIRDLDQLEQAFEIVTRIAEKHSQSEVVIHRFNPTTEELVVVHTAHWQTSPPLSRIKLRDAYISAGVARMGKTLVVPDIDHPPPEAVDLKPEDPKTRSLVNTPIQIEGNFYGNLALTYEKPHRFSENDVTLIEGLAQQLAIAIQRLETVKAQQEAEQRALAAEVMGSIGQQSFELAHRLGNELGLVKSYVNDIREELEEQGTDNPSIDSNLQRIVHDVRQVLVLSANLKKELAEIRPAQQSTSDRTAVPLGPLLNEAMNAVSAQSAKAKVHFEFKDADSEIGVYVAPKQIAAILNNLFMNAIEAMPDGGKVTLQTRQSGRYVEIDVTDTGIGIAREKQARVFDFLFSSKNSTGFGLWSARRLALENGGDLTLKESQPEQGTTFKLRLLRANIQNRGTK